MKSAVRCVAAVVLLLVSGCTDEISRLKVKVSQLETGIGDLREFQAEQTTRIANLETQLRTLRGSVEEVQYSQTQKAGTLESISSDISSLRRRVPPPAVVPEKLLEEDEAGVAQLPAEISPAATSGLQALREGNYEKALSYWQDVLDLSAGTQWSAMALFWSAVAYEGANDFKKAIQFYETLIGRFPKSDRVPFSLMREAAVFLRLGDKKLARATYSKVANDYPKSSEAKIAKERLKEIK